MQPEEEIEGVCSPVCGSALIETYVDDVFVGLSCTCCLEIVVIDDDDDD